MRLKDKVILITGAGSGIGKSTASLFAEEGATVIVNDINKDSGEKTVAEIIEKGGNAQFIKADITHESSIEEMVKQIIQDHKKIDVLFNNAGISGVGKLHELNTDDWDNILNVNIKGVSLTSKFVLPYMMDNMGGSIINMSSCVAEIGLADRTAYAATKGAVLSLTKSMQVDYAQYNIRINALLPGTIFTPFVEKYLEESYEDSETALSNIKKRQLSGELGKPKDVAYGALFLASDESKFVMGSPLYIDGGVVFGKNA